MAPMRLEIVTAERSLFSGDVDVVVAPGAEGSLGILPNHAGLMTLLQPGELMYRRGGDETYLAVTGGFLEVADNKVIVLVDAAEMASEINEERARAAVQRAQEQLANRTTEVELEQALSALRRAQVRVTVAQRRRRSSGPQQPGGGTRPA